MVVVVVVVRRTGRRRAEQQLSWQVPISDLVLQLSLLVGNQFPVGCRGVHTTSSLLQPIEEPDHVVTTRRSSHGQ